MRIDQVAGEAGSAPEPAGRQAAPGFAAVLAAQASFERLAAAPTATLGEMVQAAAAGAPLAVAPSALGGGVASLPAGLGAVTPGAAVGALAPAAKPAAGATLVRPVQGRLSSGYGPRIHPITGQRKMHNGIDFAAPSGTPITAAAGGTVTFSGWQGGYGNVVIVEHGNGLETRYAHCSRLDVRSGQRVTPGQRIAAIGSTGLSTGPHLHFEVRKGGEPVDPKGYLPG